MRLSDLSRVLKGASLVVDQIVLLGRPEVAWRFKRAKFHLGELLKVVREITFEANDDVKNHHGHKNTDDISKVSKNQGFVAADFIEVEQNGHNTSEPTEAETVPRHFATPSSSAATSTFEVDPIGWSKIDHSDGADVRSGNNSSESINDMRKKKMQERAVPSTQFGRMMGFGSLAFRMAMGEAVDRASHAMSGNSGPRHISDENAERLAESLCRMRGAALKLGQMLSLQDDSALPPSLAKALERVKQSADYMPKRQLEAQLVNQLGEDWRSKLLEFDEIPIAAASIGQVHRAKLLDGTEVAMKIQYPGVAESIDSDLNNLKRLVQMTNLLPPGLFVDRIIEVASVELKDECDYELEAKSQMEYRNFILEDAILRKHCFVPEVYPEFSTARVLTSRLVPGNPIDSVMTQSQAVRNAVARTVLILTIRELFEWRFIQSDPNFANFLYDHPSRTINMIDFGAARRYGKEFVDGYMGLVWAAANKDREGILKVSRDLGFITGDETAEFVEAHVSAGLVVGEPFLHDGSFDFGNSQLTTRLGSYSGAFMKYRLKPPPTEAYSLHRKLAGAFLLCIKLKADIPCRDILEKTIKGYKFGPLEENSGEL